MATKTQGETVYSFPFKGDPRNHNRAVQFDATDGYIGIQHRVNGEIPERVLLTPKQVVSLIKFIRENG